MKHIFDCNNTAQIYGWVTQQTNEAQAEGSHKTEHSSLQIQQIQSFEAFYIFNLTLEWSS